MVYDWSCLISTEKAPHSNSIDDRSLARTFHMCKYVHLHKLSGALRDQDKHLHKTAS